MNFFDYTGKNDSFDLQLIKTNWKWQQYSVTFPTALPTSHPELGAGCGEFFQPVGVANPPLVIFLHGVGDHSIIPCKLLARALASRGIAGFVLYLPVHTRRMTLEMKHRFPRLTDEEWAEMYRISVVNVRQVIDWAEQQSDIDSRRIGVIGISFGGFISAITMGIDTRIKSGTLIVMGGNSAKISQASLKWGTRRGYGRPEDEYRRYLATYDKYLTEVTQKGLANVNPPVDSFLTDPLTYAGLLKNRPLYMINARWDEAIPRESTIDFWQASGQPDITWLPAAHASVWVYYPLIRHRISRFFRQAFSGDGNSPTEK